VLRFKDRFKQVSTESEPSTMGEASVMKAATLIVILLGCSLNASAQPSAEPAPSLIAAAVADSKKKDKAPTKPPSIVVPPEKAAPVRLARFETPPTIDGRLDEAAWAEATTLKDFYQTYPGDNIKPTEPTEVMLGYDAKTLYIAFHAHDERGKVRATVAKRDDLVNDDNVRILLDTFNDHRKAYVLIFNPLGVQQDGIRTEGTGVDFSVDIVMESKGQITDDGYIVEVAVPFKSLRYEAGKDKLWGVHLFRWIQRFNETSSWMPLVRGSSSLLNQSGRLTGLENISTERTLEIVPSLTVSETGKRVRTVARAAVEANPTLNDPGRIVNEPVGLDPGLTMKFGITPTVTLDFAYNPDFAQVEADASVVTANQRFPIFFEEKRSFFLEGIDIFQTPLQPVHTRTIVDPDYAVKLTGKRGRNTFGLMLASDNAPGNFTEEERTDPELRRDIEQFIDRNSYIGVLRLKRDIGKQSNLGLIATSYSFIEKHNLLGGFDGRLQIDPQTTLTFQALATNSRRLFYDPVLDDDVYRTGNGFGYSVSLDRNSRHLYLNAYAEGRTRDYRADVGFTRRVNTNTASTYINYQSEPKSTGSFVNWVATNFNRIQYDWQGRIQGWNSGGRVFFNFKRQSWFGFGFDNFYERLFEEEFGPVRTAAHAGAFAGADSERSSQNRSFYFGGSTTPSKKYSISLEGTYNIGALDLDLDTGPRFPRASRAALADPEAKQDPGPGNLLNLDGSVTYQPTNALRFSLNYTKSRMVRHDTGRVAFDANIYSLKTTYQFSRWTSARARLDYNSLAGSLRAQFLVGWTPNPGTAFFVGYNDDLGYNGFNPFTDHLEPGFRRNGRTFFIKMSYLFRKSF
jgi:hypothetical protein